MSDQLPVYVDVDGTMTREPHNKWGEPRHDVIGAVIEMTKRRRVVVWSGGGGDYAFAFCAKYGIQPYACIGKPAAVIDDNPDIRPRPRMSVLGPDEFLRALLDGHQALG